MISALEGSGVLSKNQTNVLGYSLEIPDPTFEIIKDGANTTLVVNGVVRNIVSETVNVPKLRGALLDTKSEEIFVWTYEADRREAAAGESVPYTTRVESPPVGAVGFSVTFTNN